MDELATGSGFRWEKLGVFMLEGLPDDLNIHCSLKTSVVLEVQEDMDGLLYKGSQARTPKGS